jgi:hypothetical protein
MCEKDLKKIRWPDARLKTIDLNYDLISLSISESSGRHATVECLGYIGFKWVGFWDDTITGWAELLASHPFIHECRADISLRFKSAEPESGNVIRNTRNFRLLKIVFIDGCELVIVSGDIKVTT